MIALPEFGKVELLAPPTTPLPRGTHPPGYAAWMVGAPQRKCPPDIFVFFGTERRGGRRKPECQLRRTMH
jgi:hypothetical protein